MNARTIEVPRFENRALATRWARHAQLAREVLWCSVVVAVWIALWMRAAATLPQPWGPDPETREAITAVQGVSRAATAPAVTPARRWSPPSPGEARDLGAA